MEQEAGQLEARVAETRTRLDEVTVQLRQAEADLASRQQEAQAVQPPPDPGLQADMDRLRGEVDTLTRERDDLQAEAQLKAAAIETQRQELAGLEARVAELRDTVGALETRQAALHQQIAQDSKAADAGKAELEALTRQAEGLRGEAADLASRLDGLKTDEATRQKALAEIKAQIADVTGQRDGVAAEAQALRDELADLSGQRDALLAEQAELQETLAGMTAEVAAKAPPPEPARPDPGAARSVPTVDAALAVAPGLPADPGQRARLRALLIEGVCAPDALREVQGNINRQTLLVLLSRLDGC